MSPRLRFTAALASAVTVSLLWSPAGRAVTAKADQAASALAPADVARETDVKKLQENLNHLNQLFETQARILEHNSDDLGSLRNRVENYLLPSVLADPIRKGFATVVNETSALQEAQGHLATAQEKQVADTAIQFRELNAALERLGEQLAKSDQATDANLASLRQAIAVSRIPASIPSPAENLAPGWLLLAALGAATLLLAALILLSGRAQRRALEESQVQVSVLLAQVREALGAGPGPQPEVHPGVAAEHGLSSPAAESLAVIQAKLQHLLDQFNPTSSSVNSDDHTTRKSSIPPDDEHDTVHLPEPAAGGVASRVCWPAAFFEEGSPLAQWRERIETHLASSEHPALPVLSAYLALRTLCSRQPAPLLAEVGAAVVALSESLYAFVESLPGLDEDARARLGSDWIPAAKALTSVVAPKLEIREVIAGTRFDADSMQTVRQGPGNHLTVAAVLSWATLDRSGERVKILQRARIATN